jgi:purine-binding chemotaxis protein CheW
MFHGLSQAEIEVLQQRAVRYATETALISIDTIDVVIFQRGGARYGAPLSCLREIRPLHNLCRISGGSRVVPGMFYYRGEILSAHDLCAFMNSAQTGDDKASSWILIVEQEGERLGLLADEVVEIRSLLTGTSHPLPITLGDRSACFQGVLDDGLLLLHPARLFTSASFFNAF